MEYSAVRKVRADILNEPALHGAAMSARNPAMQPPCFP